MKIVNKILSHPAVWEFCQKILGNNREKMRLYRSVIKKPGKILDLGCANGNIFPAFVDFNYYGCDIDPVLIRIAKEKYQDYPKAHFILADILKRNFPVSDFDHILFGGTGHHLDDETLIRIFHRFPALLKRGGQVHYFDPISLPQDSLIIKLLINLDQGRFIRSLDEHEWLKKKLPKSLKLSQEKIFRLKNNLLPHPKFIYWKLTSQV